MPSSPPTTGVDPLRRLLSPPRRILARLRAITASQPTTNPQSTPPANSTASTTAHPRQYRPALQTPLCVHRHHQPTIPCPNIPLHPAHRRRLPTNTLPSTPIGPPLRSSQFIHAKAGKRVPICLPYQPPTRNPPLDSTLCPIDAFQAPFARLRPIPARLAHHQPTIHADREAGATLPGLIPTDP
jgi:hypothetical protein